MNHMNGSIGLTPPALAWSGTAPNGGLGSELNRLRIELMGLSDNTAKLQVICNQAVIWNITRHPQSEITEVLMDAGTTQFLDAEKVEKAIAEGLSLQSSHPEWLKLPGFRAKHFDTCPRQRDELEALLQCDSKTASGSEREPTYRKLSKAVKRRSRNRRAHGPTARTWRLTRSAIATSSAQARFGSALPIHLAGNRLGTTW
jgi:hypothetical protein